MLGLWRSSLVSLGLSSCLAKQGFYAMRYLSATLSKDETPGLASPKCAKTGVNQGSV